MRRQWNKIYFSGSPELSYSLDLWALHLDESMNPVFLDQLISTPGVSEWSVSGSADDSKIAWELQVSPVAICVANSDGSNPVKMPQPIIKGKVEQHRYPAFKR